MTKAEELKLLAQIEELINRADEDSYIRMTFDGIGAVCMENIRADFGNCPVRDLDDLRERFYAEARRHDETKRILAETQKMLKEAMNECESLKSQVRNLGQDAANLAEERDAMSDCVNGLQEIMDKQDAEIRKLKTEIVKLRMEQMTEEQVAELYNKM